MWCVVRLHPCGMSPRSRGQRHGARQERNSHDAVLNGGSVAKVSKGRWAMGWMIGNKGRDAMSMLYSLYKTEKSNGGVTGVSTSMGVMSCCGALGGEWGGVMLAGRRTSGGESSAVER